MVCPSVKGCTHEAFFANGWTGASPFHSVLTLFLFFVEGGEILLWTKLVLMVQVPNTMGISLTAHTSA